MKEATGPRSVATTVTTQRDQRWLIGALALALAVFIAYVPAMNGGFIWDDDSYVTENPLLRDWTGLKHIWLPGDSRETSTPQYYPIVFTTFWIEYHLWGLQARGYHQVNVLLHALNALLVWRLCRRIGIPGGWLIAAVFALHPVHVESVAWITERKNVLSGFFYLAAMLVYLRFDENDRPREAARGSSSGRNPSSVASWRWYALSFVLFVLALLSKSVTCSLPAALILLMLYQRKRLTGNRFLPLMPMFAIGLLLALNTAAVERDHVGASGEEFAFTIAERLLIASNALLFYPWKLLWPWPVMFIYPRWEITSASLVSWWPVAVVALIVMASVVMFVRGRRGPPLALAFYAGTVFPALGFVNIYPMVFSFVADHFQYLASLGIIAMVVGVIHHAGSIPVLKVVGAVALPVLMVMTWVQSGTYHSAETVYRDTLAKNPNAWMPHNNLGNIVLANDPTEAEFHYREALRIKPGHYPAQSNLAEALRRQERYEEAVSEAKKAIELMHTQMARVGATRLPPFLATDYDVIGRSLLSLQRHDEAEAALQESIAIAPGTTDSHFVLANVLVEQGRLDDAAAVLHGVATAIPHDWHVWRSLGVIRARQGRHADAIAAYERAVHTSGSIVNLVQVAPLLVRQLATTDDPAVRDVPRARALAEQLCEQTGWNEPALIDVLASVHFEAGRPDEAVRLAEQALTLARQRNVQELAAQIAQRLEQYRTALQPRP